MQTRPTKSKSSTSPKITDEPIPLQTLPPSPRQTPTPMEQDPPLAEPHASSEGEQESENGTPADEGDTRPCVDKMSKQAQRYVLGFCLDVVWAEEVNCSELMNILEAQSWVNLFTKCYNAEMVPSLMDEFCQNFTYNDGVISSKVKDVTMVLDAAVLAETFDVPNRGYGDYFKRESNVSIDGVTKSRMLRSLGGSSKSNSINHNQLSPLNRLLFNFVWRAIVPRTQHRNEANLLDCALIYCLATKRQINFPEIMIQHLAYTIPKKFKVGYGALFTKIFHAFNVPMNDVPILKPAGDNVLGKTSMALLKLDVVDGKVVDVKSKRAREEEVKGKTEEKEGKKRKMTGTQKGTRRSTKRVVKKTKVKSSPIEFIVDDSSEEGEGSGSSRARKGKPTEHASSSVNSLEQQLQITLMKLMDIEQQQKELRKEFKAMHQEMTNLVVTVADNHKAVLEKIDAITVEEVPADDEPTVPEDVPSPSRS